MKAFRFGFFGCFGVAAAGGVLLIVLVLLVALGSGDDEEPKVVSTPPASEAGTSVAAGGEEGGEETVGTRGNPAPIGTALEAGGWVVQVDEVVPDATDLVLAENMFNEPPAEGRQFLMARVTVQYNGDEEPATLFGAPFEFSLFGSRGVEYTTFDDDCGVVPEELDLFKELYKGGSVSGNLCWSVPSDEVDSLLLRVRIGIVSQHEMWFALR